MPHPCYDDNSPLVGATVTLYNAFGAFVAQTVTDSEGFFTFTGLPLGRYRTEIDYPQCIRRELLGKELVSPNFPHDDQAIKFFGSGEMCDVKVSLGGWDTILTDDFTHFDTLDECCANMFWYDMKGCFLRSRSAFQFEFCIDISGFGGNSDCPLDEIHAIESAMKKGLGSSSELALVEFGRTRLTNVGGEAKCIAPTFHQDLQTNHLRGHDQPHRVNLNICGVVVTKERDCKEEICLRDSFDKVVVPFQDYFYNGVFSSVLQTLAGYDARPLLDLRAVEVEESSFMTRKLLLPRTASLTKPVDGTTSIEDFAINGDMPRFYPTYISGQLCHSKTKFDSWEESHATLKECCKAFFSWDFEACCSSLDMGGC